MANCVGIDAFVRQLFKEGKRALLNVEVFAVHHGDEHEVTRGLIRLGVRPPLIQATLAQSEGLCVARESLRLATVDIAGELVQHDDQREAALGLILPRLECTS